MISAIILGFLVGATLSWGFRVFILIPVTILTVIGTMVVDLFLGASFLGALKLACVVGVAPQLGYASGLLARSVYAVLKSPRRAKTVAMSERSVHGA